jgi:hypothetical protein
MKIDYEKIFKNGNFGIMRFSKDSDSKNSLKAFVIVENRLVYETGGFDYIYLFKNENLSYSENYRIEFICKAFSFLDAYACKKNKMDCIYDREQGINKAILEENSIKYE